MMNSTHDSCLHFTRIFFVNFTNTVCYPYFYFTIKPINGQAPSNTVKKKKSRSICNSKHFFNVILTSNDIIS